MEVCGTKIDVAERFDTVEAALQADDATRRDGAFLIVARGLMPALGRRLGVYQDFLTYFSVDALGVPQAGMLPYLRYLDAIAFVRSDSFVPWGKAYQYDPREGSRLTIEVKPEHMDGGEIGPNTACSEPMGAAPAGC
jgi:hypothetical protein